METDIVHIPLPTADEPPRWAMTEVSRASLNAEGLVLLAAAEEISRVSVLESGDSPKITQLAYAYLNSLGDGA